MASRSLLSRLRNLPTSTHSNFRFHGSVLASRQLYAGPTQALRHYSADAIEAPAYLDENERKIFGLLKAELQPSKLEVQDISGGCGSMYALDIVSEQFKGMTTIKQHRLVNKVLREEIKKWHGVQLKTKAP